MKKINHNDPLSKSADIVTKNMEQLKQLFPEIVKENKIDWNALKATFGEHIDEKNERFNFTWNGKKQARREAQKTSTGTLRPCKADSVDWDNTENLYIEGDNLEVLKILQKSYHQKIKMIYIDPPYNTGKDFVYKDNYKDNLSNYLELTGQKDKDGKKLSTNADTSGRYHSNWLNMMYPRLKLARNLLTNDGVISISIDDNELQNLTLMCNEIFGESNFIANAVRRRRKSQANLSQNISTIHEYILIYSKTKEALLNKIKSNIDESKFKNPDKDSRGSYVTMPCTNKGGAKYSITTPTGNVIAEEWRFKKETYDRLFNENKLVFPRGGEGKPRYKLFLEDKKKSGVIPNSWWENISSNQEATANLKELFNDKVLFDHPKPIDLIKLITELSTDEDAICLDFFAGSSATAHAIMQFNADNNSSRKFIQVQLPEPTNEKSEAYKAGYKTITEIGKERIRRASKKIEEENPENAKKLDLGFKVFKLDSSNIKTWSASADNLESQLFDAVDNIKTDRTENDLLFEILLKYGLNLTLPITEHKVDNTTIYSVGLGTLIVCLSNNITVETAIAITELKEKQNPKICSVVFKDSGFSTDAIKTNVLQKLKQFKIEEVRSI